MITFAQNKYVDSYDFFAMSFDPYAERRASRISASRVLDGSNPWQAGGKAAAGGKIRRFFLSK